MTTITIRGNITAPPELRFTQAGKAVATVTVAENVGKDDQKRTNFHRVTLWGELGEHAASLDKGTSVIVVGRLDQKEYTDKEGNKRSSWEVTADAFGVDLRFQTVTVARAGGQGTRNTSAPTNDVWAAPTTPQTGAQQWATTPAGGADYGDTSPF